MKTAWLETFSTVKGEKGSALQVSWKLSFEGKKNNKLKQHTIFQWYCDF